ncbi:MAG: cellulase family glycosylhydrolase [Bacteroidales bacterium]|nr:cellulase family glycosylhydrolase [Bacteroidales bacterium]
MISLIPLLMIFHVLSACTDPEPDSLILQVDASHIGFEAVGGQDTFHMVCNKSWKISGTTDWCALSAEAGEGDAAIILNVDGNAKPEVRSTTLTIMAEEKSKTINITQKANEEAPKTIFTFDIPPDDTDMRDLTSVELAGLMGIGWNLGNSLEAIGGETAWGNPVVTQRLIDSVKAAGFTSIRIPVAWSVFTDASTFTISQSWMERVEEVVNYALSAEMYVVMNIHWDGGWMQPTYAGQDYVNTRLAAMWRQIATYFRDYNDYLLFAGTNEVMVDGDYGTPTPEYYTVQNSFNQTFITTVRATGGRNAYRHLVVQGFNTNINHTVSYAVIPEDTASNRMMMEVHYYDPYNFALNENSGITQWGEIATDPSKTDSWGNEDYADGQFQKMKTNFIDKGIAVIVGEYGAISRLDVEGHETFRVYFNEYITQSMVDHECVPFYWDNGYPTNHAFGLFNRTTGAQVYPELINAIVKAGAK